MDILKGHEPELIIALFVLIVLQFGLNMMLGARVKYIRKTLRTLLTGPTGEDLEGMLKRCLQESGHALERGDELEGRLLQLGKEMTACVQHVGLVRFDAYGDVSGKQSFSLALLDGHRNGVLVTGLFGRQDGRCYGKAVLDGQTEQALTDEESSALQMALGGGLAQAGAALPSPTLNGKRRLGK